MSEGEIPSSSFDLDEIAVAPRIIRELRIMGIDLSSLALKRTRVGWVYTCPSKNAPRRLVDGVWV